MYALDVPVIKRPEAYWLLAEGDDVLDYRQAVAKYPHSKQDILPGGNHNFSRWHDYMDAVIDYAALTAALIPPRYNSAPHPRSKTP